MIKRILFLIVLVSGSWPSIAQESRYRYLVIFKDKNNSPFSVNKPADFLSPAAINRRAKNKIGISTQDLPVNPSYIQELKSAGAQIIYPLKWMNGVLIKDKPANIGKIKALKSVAGLYKNMPLDSSSDLRLQSESKQKTRQNSVLDYGNSLAQLNQLGIDKMHTQGYTGKGIKIAVLDDGFSQADQIGILQTVYSEKRMLATLVTDPGLSSVYVGGAHGTNVWSTIAAQSPGKLIGAAFDAQFALAQTEESDHELLVEEANWMRGAEWADSLGTDIITSSLGYSEFDNSNYDHRYADMDGRTTLVSKAAAWAASKGIICTVSAGNQGNVSWKYISAPADADSILSVGAVDRTGIRTSFSSIGPSFDQRIKPDVAAMGLSTVGVQPSGTIASFNGTSFSAPLMAGLVAGILQANPQKTAQEIIQVVRKSGTQASKPDQLLGYGIPHFDRVSQILNPILGNELPVNTAISVYPNPVSLGQKIQVKTGGVDGGTLDIINMQGAIVQSISFQQTEFDFYVAPFISGKYYFRFTIGNQVSLVPLLLNL